MKVRILLLTFFIIFVFFKFNSLSAQEIKYTLKGKKAILYFKEQGFPSKSYSFNIEDSASFKQMGFLFSKDKNWIYERGMKIRNVDYTSFQTLKDSKVLPFLKNYYFKRYCGIDNLNFYVFSTSFTDEIFT